MQDLTRRQQQLLDGIRRHLKRYDIPPTLREMAAMLQVSGTLGVLKHLRALEGKGYIKKESGAARGIRLVGQEKPAGLPIVGIVRAGAPQPAIETIEGYLEPADSRNGDFYLRVRGDSMIEDAICDGDLALVRPQATANNGDIVVALIDDEATLKRFYHEGERIRLQPANSRLKPLFFTPEDGSTIRIVGKVISIVRNYE